MDIGESESRRTVALFVLAGAGLVSAVNVSVVNVALADLARDLGATTADLQWIISSYTLMYVGLMLAAAAFGDRIGRVRAFRLGLVLTILSSAGAAFASSPGGLIAWRALMGGAVALLVPVSLSIVADLYPEPRERARAFGLWIGLGSLGNALGPITGGLLLEHFWWGAVFVLNVPILLAFLIASIWSMPKSTVRSTTPLDAGGMVLSIAGLGLVVWAVIEVPLRGWTDGGIVLAFVAGALLIALVVVWEQRVEHPLVDVSLLRDSRVSVALASFAAVTFAFSGMLLVASLLLRSVYHHGPLGTGIALAPLAVFMACGSTMSARIVDRIGMNRTVACGLGLVAVGTALFAPLQSDSGYGWIAIATSLTGFGFGVSNAPLVEALTIAIPPHKTALASALGTASRQLGQVLGVAVLGSVLSAGYQDGVTRSAQRLGVGPDGVAAARESITRGLEVARDIGGDTGRALADGATTAFMNGSRAAAIGGVVCAGAVGVLALRSLPRRMTPSLGTQPVVVLEPADGGD